MTYEVDDDAKKPKFRDRWDLDLRVAFCRSPTSAATAHSPMSSQGFIYPLANSGTGSFSSVLEPPSTVPWAISALALLRKRQPNDNAITDEFCVPTKNPRTKRCDPGLGSRLPVDKPRRSTIGRTSIAANKRNRLRC